MKVFILSVMIELEYSKVCMYFGRLQCQGRTLGIPASFQQSLMMLLGNVCSSLRLGGGEALYTDVRLYGMLQ